MKSSDIFCKTILPTAGHVGEAFDGSVQVAVGMPPRRHSREILLGQAVVLCQLSPHRFEAMHLFVEGARLSFVSLRLDIQELSDAGPHPPPSEKVAVRDVVRLAGQSLILSRPRHVAR